MSEEKKKRIVKRLPAPITIGLRKLHRDHEDLKDEFKSWAKDRCDELGYYRDQVNFETGAVLDPIKGDRIITRLPLEGRSKEIINEASEKLFAINKARKLFSRRLADVCLEYAIPSNGLNLDTGEISEDVRIVDALTVEEQEKADAASVAGKEKIIKDIFSEDKDE